MEPQPQPCHVAEVAKGSWDDDQPPRVYLQWKNIDVCFDFQCQCGLIGHFDGYFARQFQCSGCRAFYAMPDLVQPINLDKPMLRTSQPVIVGADD